MPKGKRKLAAMQESEQDSEVCVAITYKNVIAAPGVKAPFFAIHGVEFNQKSISKTNKFEFDSSKQKFTTEIGAKFVAFVGKRKTYSDSPMDSHLIFEALRNFNISPPENTLWAYNYFKALQPENPKVKGQPGLDILTTEYKVDNLTNAAALAKVIMLMKKELQEKNMSADEIDQKALARKRKKPTAPDAAATATAIAATAAHDEKSSASARLLPVKGVFAAKPKAKDKPVTDSLVATRTVLRAS